MTVRQTDGWLGGRPRFTPVHSRASNAIAEAFVKTFKRDYARIHPLPDAATVLRQTARWFDDYKESHPHPGLGIPPVSSFGLKLHSRVSGQTGATPGWHF
jgi:transposase InsO family protein